MTDPDDLMTRVELIRKLDRLENPQNDTVLDPTCRTIDGRPLTDAEATILRACTVDDFGVVADMSRMESRRYKLGVERLELMTELGPLLRGGWVEGQTVDKIITRVPFKDRARARRLYTRLLETDHELGND